MHETVVATSIARMVCEAAATHNAAQVRRVHLDVGVFSCLEPETLTACFELVCERTAAHGAELVIRRVPAAAVCQACGHGFALHSPRELCPACGESRLSCEGGRELIIQGIEVEGAEGASPTAPEHS